MRLVLCCSVITAIWLLRQLWSWGKKLNRQPSLDPALGIAQRLGATLGLERALWRNRVTAWGVRGLLALMLALIALPAPNLLACACSEVVVGSATTTSNMSVNNTKGSLQLTQSDIEIPGNTPIRLVRTYNSDDNTFTLFGQGWTVDFISYLITTTGDIQVYINGTSETFLAAKSYSNAKATMKLSFVGMNEVKVADRNGNSWYYNLTSKCLTSTFDASGNETDYTWAIHQKEVSVEQVITLGTYSYPMYIYTAIYCPLTVTYQDGRQLLFTYSTTPAQEYLCTQVQTTSSGFTVSYSYTDGLLTGISKANGQTLAYGYHTLYTSLWPAVVASPGIGAAAAVDKTQGWLTSITYASGATVNIDYNGNYGSFSSPLRVTSITGPEGYSHTYGYPTRENTNDITTVQTDGLAHDTTYAYTSVTNSAIVNEVDTDALTNSVSTINNDNNLPLQVTDKRGHVTHYRYDSTNSDPVATRNLLSVTNALGKVWSYGYDTNSNVTNSVDPLSHNQTYTYDSSKRLTSSKNGLGQLIRTNTYTAYGQVGSIMNGVTNTTSYLYNTNGYRTNTVDSAGKNWSATYDVDGNQLTATNPLGKTTSYTYDKFYKVASVTNALSQVTLFTRDDMADLTAVRDANGNATHTAYDLLQRPAAITNALGNVTRFTYNVESGTTRLTDALTNSYSYTYDALNRSKTFGYPDSSHESYVYDANGNTTSITNAAGQTAIYTYDNADRGVTKTWQGGTNSVFNYDYDNANHPTSVVKIVGVITNSVIGYVYNAANQMVTNVSEGYAVAYQYDSAQRLSQVVYPSGAKAHYAYNSRSAISAINDETNGAVSGCAYDDAGRLTKRTLANGLETIYDYNSVDQVTKITLRQASNTNNVVQSFQYGYDNVGNKLWVKYASGSGDVYQYDAAYQLTGVKYGVTNAAAGYVSAAGGTRTVTYSYDAVGNRTGMVDGASTTTYTVNNLNQYTAAGGVNYTYGNRGDLIGDGTWTYGYDPEGHLISASKTGTTVGYVYDAVGRRSQKSINGIVTKYIYAGNNLIEERDGSGAVLAKYVYDGGIDAPIRAVKGGNTYYFQQDALGNITSLTDGSGSIVESYAYDAYGAPTIKNASGTTLTSASTPFLFTGREYDSETGLYHYRARAYSPILGRWLQRDSLPNAEVVVGPNLYAYVGNNPVNETDPSGLVGWGFFGGVSGGGGLGYGGTASASVGLGMFLGPNPNGSLGSLGVYSSTGDGALLPGGDSGDCNHRNSGIGHWGVGGGVGGGGFLTNANNAEDLSKTTNTLVFNIGFGIDVGGSISWGGGVAIVEVGTGPGGGANLGQISTTTHGYTLRQSK